MPFKLQNVERNDIISKPCESMNLFFYKIGGRKMQSGKRVAKRESKHVLRRLLVVILIAIVGTTLYVRAISEAKQSRNVQQCKILLNDIFSFEIKAEGWAEEEAIKQIVKEFNKEHGYNGTQYQYKIYEAQDGYYWITSEFVYNAEFEMKAERYFTCVVDMSIGLQSEEASFIFEYMTEKQRLDYEAMILESKMMVQDIIDIQEEHNTYNEVTFITVTIKLKSNFVTEGDIISLSVNF